MSPLCTGIVHPQAYPPVMFLICRAIWYRLTKALYEAIWSYFCEYVHDQHTWRIARNLSPTKLLEAAGMDSISRKCK